MPEAATPSMTQRVLAPYQRITSSGQFIPEIDGFRFVAIFSVFLYHLAGDILRHSSTQFTESLKSHWLFILTQNLNIGVPLFFVISGFILGLPFAASIERDRPLSLKRYYWRRVTRLEPPYIVSLLLFFVLKLAGGRGAFLTLLPRLIASIFYVHNQVYAGPSAINVVAWSLEIEIQFYILAPALAMIFRLGRGSRRIALLASCAAFSLVAYWFRADPRIQLSLLGNLGYFVGGFLLIDMYLEKSGARVSKRVWDVISTIGWSLLFGGLVFAPTVVTLLVPIGVPYLYYAAFRGSAANTLFKNVWLTTMGGMCYSIYLVHNYVISASGFQTQAIGASLPFELRLLIQLLLIAPVTILVSALFFRLVERPCMRPDWPHRLALWLRSFHAVRPAFGEPPS